MATKKQKRAAAEAKHEEFMAEVRQTGLEAQCKDRARGAAKAKRAEEDAKKRNQKVSTLKAINDMNREAQIELDRVNNYIDSLLCDELRRLEHVGLFPKGYHDINCPIVHHPKQVEN